MMQIKGVTTKNSEKGQSTIGLLIFCNRSGGRNPDRHQQKINLFLMH